MTVTEILTSMADFIGNLGLEPFIYAAIVAASAIKIGSRLARA